MHICTAHFSKYGHRMPRVKRKSYWVISNTQPAYLLWPTPKHSRGIRKGGCGRCACIAVEKCHKVLALLTLCNFISFFLFFGGGSGDIMQAVVFPSSFKFLNDCHCLWSFKRQAHVGGTSNLCSKHCTLYTTTLVRQLYSQVLRLQSFPVEAKKKEKKHWKHLPSLKQ